MDEDGRCPGNVCRYAMGQIAEALGLEVVRLWVVAVDLMLRSRLQAFGRTSAGCVAGAYADMA